MEIRTKYTTVQVRATSVYGVSAGHLPNQVRRKKLATNLQYTNRAIGEKFIPLKIRDVEEIVNTNKNTTARTRPNTPPSLLGMERRIA
jgi:hypothetical protein